jgi:hypothetical protein
MSANPQNNGNSVVDNLCGTAQMLPRRSAVGSDKQDGIDALSAASQACGSSFVSLSLEKTYLPIPVGRGALRRDLAVTVSKYALTKQ